MSELALVPHEMHAASAAAESAARRARDADGEGALATLSGALPGTTTAQVAGELGEAWSGGVRAWSAEVVEFGASVAQLAEAAAAVDAATLGRFAELPMPRGEGG